MKKSSLSALLVWFRRVKRPMPWRLNPSPYSCWLSEIMMQQTTYEQALPYYTRFLTIFPTVEALAQAKESAVLKAWEGLGYYARARNLHKAAQVLVARGWPKNAVEWQEIPGIGPYTAAALASVLLDEKIPVVDGNVARVFARYWRLTDDFKKLPARVKLANRLKPLMCGRPGDFNQAMMELGALVCTPKSPDCSKCPLRSACASHKANCALDYPSRTERKPLPVRHDEAIVVTDGVGKVLLVQNTQGGLLKGLWDLPTMKKQQLHTQVFSHFKLERQVWCGETKAMFVDPRQVPLTTATRKILVACGILA